MRSPSPRAGRARTSGSGGAAIATLQGHQLEVGADFFEHICTTISDGYSSEVVMVIPDLKGNFLLMTKDFYPKGVYRLPSGKISANENPDDALRRELLEETGFTLEVDGYLGELQYTFRDDGRSVGFVSYVYLLAATGEIPRTLDSEERIADFVYVSPRELHVVADRLRKLGHPWTDWGHFRAIAHDLAADVLSDNCENR